MKKIIILLLITLIQGCMTLDEYHQSSIDAYKPERIKYVNKCKNISAMRKQAVIEGKIILGLTETDLIYLMGYPSRRNKTVGAWGIYEQWVYEHVESYSVSSRTPYFYFENGILTSWQES